MDFWAFLNWVWQQIDKVLLWFGGSFWTLYNGANNAWNWAKTFAQDAYNNAVAFVTGKVNELRYLIFTIEAYLYKTAYDLYYKAKDFATSLYNQAIYALNVAIAYVYIQVNKLYAAAKDFATELYNKALYALYVVEAYIFIEVNKLYGALLVLVPGIKLLQQLIDGKILPQLLALAQKFYGQIVSFFDDPLGFILGLMWSQFTTFLCFALGYGLGSVETQLPVIPVWGKRFSGGGGLPPIIPPQPGGLLVRPVNPLYVSGYTFGTGHYGTDFGIADAQDILASHTGIITFAGWDVNGYGNRIDVSGSPYWSRYGHNKQVLVSVGQTVQAGQVIAYGNSTGNSTGSHLHFELKVNGSYVDPILFL